MKKILGLVFAIFILGLFITACENAISPEDRVAANNIALSKSDKLNENTPSRYALIDTNPLSDVYDNVLLIVRETLHLFAVVKDYFSMIPKTVGLKL